LIFHLTTFALAAGLFVLIGGAAVTGVVAGTFLRERQHNVKESSGVLQGALLGFMGLVLAFGLSLALGRYEARRAALVDDANTIGTAYLRAQTLPEPMRSRSLSLLVRYTDVEIELTHEVPGTAAARRTVAEGSALQRPLWADAARAVQQEPVASAARLYEESLNEMIDQQTVRVSGLGNRVPTEVLVLEVTGAALAMLLLGLHVGVLGRSLVPALLAASLVSGLLFVTFDLDRPTRGLITIPDAALTSLRASMELPPAAGVSP
jgi:hypothetical protein